MGIAGEGAGATAGYSPILFVNRYQPLQRLFDYDYDYDYEHEHEHERTTFGNGTKWAICQLSHAGVSNLQHLEGGTPWRANDISG